MDQLLLDSKRNSLKPKDKDLYNQRFLSQAHINTQ